MPIIACSGSFLSCSSVPPARCEAGPTKDRGIQHSDMDAGAGQDAFSRAWDGIAKPTNAKPHANDVRNSAEFRTGERSVAPCCSPLTGSPARNRHSAQTAYARGASWARQVIESDQELSLTPTSGSSTERDPWVSAVACRPSNRPAPRAGSRRALGRNRRRRAGRIPTRLGARPIDAIA